jgi:DMSO/TMAO reductase YedYZ molybdopterin-dependent catalytic subunit
VRRRQFIELTTLSLASALLLNCDSEGPRSAQPVLRAAERWNEKVERALFRHRSMDYGTAVLAGAAYPKYFVSDRVPVWNETDRGPWSMEITGLVDRPFRLTLADLQALPSVTQRVNHYCVEGWTAVVEYTGVRVVELARRAGVKAEAQYVDFASFDSDYHESWDLASALHPQTLVAYALDGHFLSAGHGAPARLHSPIKLGYKCTKYLTRVEFMAERNGGYWSDRGYEWYGGT